MNDIDLLELLDRLTMSELVLLEAEFGVFATAQCQSIRAWAQGWLAAMRRAEGFDTLGAVLPVTALQPDERQAVMTDVQALAERHRDDDGLVAFCSTLAALLDFAMLDDAVTRAESIALVQAHIDSYRRLRPYGTPCDTSRIRQSSEITDPGDSA